MKKNQIKKLPKVKLFFIVFGLLVLLVFIIKPSYARYIYNGIKDYYYETQNFYFNCDKLSVNNAVFQLDNWDGVNTFPVTYNLNSIKNDLIHADENIDYVVESYKCTSNFYVVDVAFNNYSVGDKITEGVYNALTDADKAKCSAAASCTISKEEGIISKTTHADNFVINITPTATLSQGDSITLTVKVTSTAPYTKTLTGVVRLNVGVPGISYEITDKGGQPYLDFKITNTLDYYHAITAFGDYDAGGTVELEAYNNLSDTDKAKCTSALIKLTFNPNIILVDVTSDFYDNAYSYTTRQIDGKAYIDSVTFGVDRVSSMSVRFYKVNAINNYTYPYNNNSPIINFQVLQSL